MKKAIKSFILYFVGRHQKPKIDFLLEPTEIVAVAYVSDVKEPFINVISSDNNYRMITPSNSNGFDVIMYFLSLLKRLTKINDSLYMDLSLVSEFKAYDSVCNFNFNGVKSSPLIGKDAEDFKRVYDEFLKK